MMAVWHLDGAGYSYIVYHGIRALLQYFIVSNLLRSISKLMPPADVQKSTPEENLPSSVTT